MFVFVIILKSWVDVVGQFHGSRAQSRDEIDLHTTVKLRNDNRNWFAHSG